MSLKLPYSFSQEIKRRKTELTSSDAKFFMTPLKKMCITCRSQKENVQQVGIRIDMTKHNNNNAYYKRLLDTEKWMKGLLEKLEDKNYKLTPEDAKTAKIYLGYYASELSNFPTNKGKRGFLKRRLAPLQANIESASKHDTKYPVYVCSEECFNMLVLNIS